MRNRNSWKPIRSVFGIIGISAILFTASPRLANSIETPLSDVVRSIGQLKALDAQLTKEILLLKHGIVRDYDSLQSITEATDFTIATLKLPKPTGAQADDEDLPSLLETLKNSLVQRLVQVERFKSKNAIARNSSTYFTYLLIKTAKNNNAFNLLERDVKRLSDLRTLMLAYSLNHGPAVENAFIKALGDIRDSAALLDQRRANATTLLTQIANHGEVMIKANHEVNKLVAQIISQDRAQLLEMIDYRISEFLESERG
ncbi:MAG: DAHL domain-containing protein [Methyloligellaceae bacterium]